jgi:hypothetical protein
MRVYSSRAVQLTNTDCLAEIVEQKCQVEFSLPILTVVIVCGALKVLLMALVLWMFDQEALVTIGDAIHSFMTKPDHTTEGRCLMSRHDVHKSWKSTETIAAKQWHGARHTWGRACSTRRWILSTLMYASLPSIIGTLFNSV